MRSYSLIAVTVIAAFVACDKTSPNRDQVPVIQSQFGRLQVALQNRDLASLDSLASGDLTDDGLSIDSLARFVLGAQGEKRFDHFGPIEIIYNKKKARIDCALIDSSGQKYLDVTWTLVREKDSWLLKRFETGVPPIDSVR